MADKSRSPKLSLRGYRAKFIAAAGVFFVLALILSGSFLFFGQNTISGNNITIAVRAPAALGGGDELLLDIAVTNKNAVTVESATLIVEYPPGTQEADVSGKELFRQRVPVGSIRPGEVLTVPVKARLFGEENEEKTIHISVEYRVAGSNATFFKEAEPLIVTVSTSPVVLSVKSNREVSSGQEFTLTLTLTANTETALENVLVEATYPSGFDFNGAEPAPVKGQSIWRVDSLPPESKKEIVLRGVLTGSAAEERTFKFALGVPSDRDRFALASILTTAAASVSLTNPFVGLSVTTNGSAGETVTLAPSDSAVVSISFKNTLADTIYNGTIKAVLTGNGLNTSNVTSAGFFDSGTRTIVWDSGTTPGLSQIAPGDEETVSFSIRGANLDAERTPQVSYAVSVSGRRVSESSVPQELTNIESRTIRFASVASVTSHGLYSIGAFSNSGPMPPRAETATQYTIMLEAHNGSNELADATVSMTLPPYVSWQSAVASGSDVSYAAATREVSWRIGTLMAGATAKTAFQVSLVPSVSQVGSTPTLVGEQNLRATDRFTGSVVRATAPAIRTALPYDPNPDAQNGRVLPKE